MKVDESQKNQFIVLCVLILLVIGFGAYRLVGVKTSAAPKTATKQVSESDQSQSSEKPQAEEKSTDSQDVVVVDPVHLPASVKDPFLPQVNMLKSDQKQSNTQIPVKTRPNKRSAQKALAPMMPNVFPAMSDMQVKPVSASGKDPAMQAEADPTKDLKLTGVIEGDTNTAIIRGGNVRYIVHEGQTIDGKCLVESIERTCIILRFNGKKFVLRLGGNDSSEKGTRKV
jgi:cytoskeletal protein RodZ